MSASPPVVFCECFARDGLQHEPAVIPAARKAAILEQIADCGFRRIEITSFSHPRYVPQFADADAVLASVKPRDGVLFKATCPNPQAVQRALAAQAAGRGPEEISFLVSASEGHTQRNLRRSRAEQWAQVEEMAALAGGAFTIVGTISVAFDCPFDGPVPPARVLEDARRFVALGVSRLAIGDTIGSATPPRVRALMRLLREELPEDVVLIAHFHDSRGTGVANCVAALEAGITHFDTALGGTGGHPAGIAYGEGFTGNVCSEDLATLFEAMGVPTGLDIEALRAAGRVAEALLGRRLHARTTRLGEHA
ncbi:hydroxymethylglutaryl-CoA lyase [Roseomonas aerophila]|uniref:Hydroxymethylglutaryl-CoA lyase n=1 Tax=Teichococcus aerophilus TaxID=1224513 RepID=A0ABR7RIF4_9PROT|nr:hydroxymethylglutaryl-CoA lyase [Pseudoroseomonas aerophila]MBC9206359.1 hydroxymethylglutaryl-CoA lyase [Pseudoroseomonas aerophila]